MTDIAANLEAEITEFTADKPTMDVQTAMAINAGRLMGRTLAQWIEKGGRQTQQAFLMGPGGTVVSVTMTAETVQVPYLGGASA